MRSDPCITRGEREAVTVPNSVFTWLPELSNLAAELTLAHCVWLKTLYASQRSWKFAFSFTLKFLNVVMSQLFVPGPLNSSGAAFPIEPLAGRPTFVVLNH